MKCQIILLVCIVLLGVLIPGILADGNSTGSGDSSTTPTDVPTSMATLTEEPLSTGTGEPTVPITVEPTITQTETETTPEPTPTVTVISTVITSGFTGASGETNTTNTTTKSDNSDGTSETNSSITGENSSQSSGEQNTSLSVSLLETSYSSNDDQSQSSPVVTLGTVTVSGSGISNVISINKTGGIAGNAGYTWTSSDSYIISSSGSYRLDEDISTSASYAIQIVASDVTLDGNGHTISGGTTAGVEVKSGANNVAIENFGGISGTSTGIESWGDDTTIRNNSISSSFRGIYTAGSHATIDNNMIGGDPYSVIDGIETSGYYTTITNNSITGTAVGIQSRAKGAVISDNIIDQNFDTGIYSASGTANTQTIISNNSISGIEGANNGIDSEAVNTSILNNVISGYRYSGTGINSQGTNSVIEGNEVSENVQGISTAGNNVTISQNTIHDNSGDGISVGSGENRTISGNNITNNNVGISLYDNYKSTNITGNKIQDNSDGIYINDGGGGGDGYIVNNYLGNEENADGDGNPSVFTWNVKPTPGTNVFGGPNLAGNYWSDETGTGWSDQQTPNETGYTTTPYEITTGVYDNTPLVRTTTTPTPSPTPTASPTPTVSPTPTPTVSPTVTTTTIPVYDDTDHASDPSLSIPGIHLTVVTASLPPVTKPGDFAELQLILQNSGSISLPDEARIVLSPINPLAKSVGEQPAIYENGKYLLTFQLQVPKDPGTYIYLFNPVQITRDPTTGTDIRIPAGDPVQFTVIVGTDGIVEVTSP